MDWRKYGAEQAAKADVAAAQESSLRERARHAGIQRKEREAAALQAVIDLVGQAGFPVDTLNLSQRTLAGRSTLETERGLIIINNNGVEYSKVEKNQASGEVDREELIGELEATTKFIIDDLLRGGVRPV